MVGDERISLTFVVSSNLCIIKPTTIGMLTDNVVDNRLHKAFLEVERCFDTFEGQTQHPVSDRFGQPGGEAFHHDIELAVVQKVFERLLHLLCLVGADFTELLWYSHQPIWFSTMSESTSAIFRPAAATCWGMKLVAVMPGVVFTSSIETLPSFDTI